MNRKSLLIIFTAFILIGTIGAFCLVLFFNHKKVEQIEFSVPQAEPENIELIEDEKNEVKEDSIETTEIAVPANNIQPKKNSANVKNISTQKPVIKPVAPAKIEQITVEKEQIITKDEEKPSTGEIIIDTEYTYKSPAKYSFK